MEEDCNWVMRDQLRTRKEKDEFIVMYTLLMQQRGQQPSPEVIKEYM